MYGAERRPARWPGVLGVIGIILAVLCLWDELNELIRLFTWNEEDWVRLLGAETARLVQEFAPPLGFAVASALINIELSILLFIGSVLLIRRSRAGVSCCRVWAWLVLPWLAIQLVLVLTWMRDHLSGLLQPAWQVQEATIVLWTVFAFFVIAIFPIFVLVWFARPGVRAEYATWDMAAD
jgi:hypothetical protein